MRSAIITIGDEILIGQVTDTNAVWISQQLNAYGIQVGEMVTVSDDAGQITNTLDRYMGHFDLVIMTGGLGPTSDDITKQTLADYFNSKMVMQPEVLEKITAYFKEVGRSMLEVNRLQAEVPEDCMVLINDHGTAPGMWFEKEGTILVSMPGVPYEMKGLMEDRVIPELVKRIEMPLVVHKTILTQGVPESYLAAMLRDWEKDLPDCVKLAYLPRPGIVRLRLTLVDNCASDADQILEKLIGKLLKIMPEHIFGYDDMSLEESLGVLLRERGLSLASAESCTGGTIASMITSVPGSSDYYTGSVIAYNNRIKTEILGVDPSIIEEKGAVCREVVEQMARGIRAAYGTDTSIATSGIAGPGGGSEEKPVGTTWICVQYGDRSFARKYRFSGNRERVIIQASNTALQLLRRVLLNTI